MEIHKYKSAFPMCTDISFNVDSNSEITQLFEEAGLFPHLIHTLLAQRFTAYDSNGFATLTTAPVGDDQLAPVSLLNASGITKMSANVQSYDLISEQTKSSMGDTTAYSLDLWKFYQQFIAQLFFIG